MAEVPESLYVMNNGGCIPYLILMCEIFEKRRQTLDLISMMRELKRATNKDFGRYRSASHDYMSIKVDSLSTLPTFQKKEEEHSS